MAEGATTRAKALSQSDSKSQDNMADLIRHDDNIKESMPATLKTLAKKGEKSDKKDTSVKGDRDKTRVKARTQKNKANKVGVNSNQIAMDGFLQPKGFVADMVEHINSTPPNSPPNSTTSSQTKKKMLAIRNGQLALEEDDSDQCFQSSNMSNDHARYSHRSTSSEQEMYESEYESEQEEENDNANLMTILKQLNSSVKKLEKSVNRMGAQHKDTERKVSTIEVVQSQDSVKLRGIVESLDNQQDKIDMLIGIVAKQDVQIKALQSRWDAAYAKESKDNIVINGLSETQGENCYHEVGNFFKNILKVEKPIQIQKAHRMGKGNNKPILAQLKHSDDRAKIYEKVGNLKEANRGRDKPYFISDQLPESWAERKKFVHFLKQQNKKLPTAQQATASVDRGILSFDGVQYQPPIRAPLPAELCTMKVERKAMLRELEFTLGKSEEMEKSTFVGYAAEIFSAEQAQKYYDALKMKVPDATHIACAFLIPAESVAKSYGCIDDGEHGAGRTLLNMLVKNKAQNRAVFITRHYGGKHIGATRFQIMERVGSSALLNLNAEISRRRAPLNDEELKRLNEEIQQEAARKQRLDNHRKQHPWATVDNPDNTQENW